MNLWCDICYGPAEELNCKDCQQWIDYWNGLTEEEQAEEQLMMDSYNPEY